MRKNIYFKSLCIVEIHNYSFDEDDIMKKYLVTGSAGFIGFYVAKALLDRGDEVIGIGAGVEPDHIADDENVGRGVVGQVGRRAPELGAVARREGDQVVPVGPEERLVTQYQGRRCAT